MTARGFWPREKRYNNEQVPQPEVGSAASSYEILAKLATGGMAEIFLARGASTAGIERYVVLKRILRERATDASFVRMFLDEAKLAARLRHTNVVEVFDLGEASGKVYQAMELVDGDSLAGLLTLDGRRPVAPEIAARIAVDVLRGLHAAHQLADDHGRSLELVHRDVSPQNILVGLDGVAKIADFGVARALGSLGKDDLVGPVGKRAYMAPEQLVSGEIDRRCDVFSVGVVLWELLAGVRANEVAQTFPLAGEALPNPCTLHPAADASLGAIALRAAARDPEGRFPTADAMADAIEEAAMRSGLVLSTKRVHAWVTGLVGARLSQQRETARREFELSRVALKSAATTTMPEPTGTTVAGAHPHLRTARAILLGAVVVSSAVFGAVLMRRQPRTAPVAAPVVVAPPPPASVAPASTAPTASTSAASAPPSASSVSPPPPRRSSAAPRPVGKSSTPSLPYDNPYKR